MAILNPNNKNHTQVSLYDGGGVPSPVTPPSYSFQGGNLNLVVNGGANASPTPVLYGDGNTVQLPDPTSYAANSYNATAYADGAYNSGNNEGVVSTSPDVPKVEAPATDLSYSGNAGSAPSTTPTSTESSTPTTTPPTTSPPANPTTEEAGTYYDYLKDEVPESLRDIYNDEIVYQDQQNAQLVEDINGIRDTTIENAGNIRDTAYENAETQKETTYTYADKALMETLGFNEEQYKYLLDSINASKETGLALAEDVRATLLSLAAETRDQIYQAAEAARVREYEQAEIVRQRGIVDANTSYEQNKATYGANAEALASMGLTGGGYSDYLNAQAYAAQRSEVQAVNAGAEATKRAARYAEDDKKMNADTTYAANVKEAELNYSEQVGEVNATYEAALREANLWKIEADYAANRENTDTKFKADTTYNAAIGEADASYAENVADANLQADLAIADANAATAEAKHRAEQALKEGLLTNEQAVAQYRDEMFYYFLDKAGTGSYTTEQLDTIASELEFSDTQKQMLHTALGDYNTAVEEEEAAKAKEEEDNLKATSYQNYQSISSAIKYDSDSYSEADLDRAVTEKALTPDDADILKKELADARVKEIKDLISSGDTSGATARADELYGSGKIDKDTYQTAYYDSWVKDLATVDAANIDTIITNLTKDKNAGKISANDHSSLIKYMYSKFGSTQKPSENGYVANEMKPGQKWQTFTFDGTNYWADSTEFTDTETIAMLNGISTGNEERTPAQGTTVRYNGVTYAYVRHVVEYGFLNMKSKWVTEWTPIHNNYGDDPYGEKIDSTQAVTPETTPTHKAGAAWSSYEEAAADGFANIMTRSEWAGRKSSTGCDTYQEYLDKMYAKYVG